MSSSRFRPFLTGLLATALGAVMLVAPAVAVADEGVQARPRFRVPFDCGQVWNANTRTNHRPLYAVDFQRSSAFGQRVRASFQGRVVTVRDLGNASYGKYVVIKHGTTGWRTLYAHLRGYRVEVGQHVDTGQVIGKVGSSGSSSGPHLHYEQIRTGSVVKVVLKGSLHVDYFGNTRVVSSTRC